MSILKKENIILNSSLASKEEAIKKAGQILVEQGYVSEDYVPAMLQREEISSTYMGNFLAIPHGTDEAKTAVLNSGLSVIQAPNGVDFGDGNIVKLIIGIAGKDGEHLELLSQIAIVCSEMENVEKLVAAKSEEEIIQILSEVE
ncbi:Mannitol-specific phosphotransferase enzyme IIA component [Niallia circulans]|jgi:mannitol PTS system EIIA component|uniref:Mannitol-specific phosphotransferase enzyme IIA component n=1 Tax=Niallia circulans TaxID=1397 RepID=A0A0J1I961_NIACI|nr:PTS sugar transporter subunit IIA [Niallia circulans]AYV69080.1 PTS mannitol transporter subunit IIA [Niallia circulans]AYV72529.1 PTS mannitol transporter subunit IIA [Niallia circulans]KLV22493.1 PTS mannitol transporter subunit IIA [Niallia circulans]MCM2983163.1 PTS sugar transporter subunit IIA [Niallia circulans]MDR4318324.1 PTS mannitol transporter subunit IIA [Niallia circulans]